MSRPELAFVLAPRQNHFFVELVSALRNEVEAAGAGASVHVGNFPAPRPDLVYVLVPPHEYFTLMHGRYGPLPDVLQRTIFICAEQPTTHFFDHNIELAPRAGAVFDINRAAVRAFGWRGIEAEHLQLGWTQEWDHLRDRERDIDVVFMGSISEKREIALSTYGRTLSRWRTELVISDNARPNWSQSQSFHADERKWDLLGRAKILLNIHQGEEPYFEWLRIAQAISSGAVVVSEYSSDFEPLVPGEHLLMGGLESLDLLVEGLLVDGERRWQMQTDAYKQIREIKLADSVRRLIEVAADLATTKPVPDAGHRFFTQPQPDPEKLPIVGDDPQPPRLTNGDHDASWMRRALKDLRLELLELRREQARTELEAACGGRLPGLKLIAMTPSFRAAAPRVSVLTALYNHAVHVTSALSSAANSIGCDYELIIVDDGSNDESTEVVQRWMDAHREVPAMLLHHPINRGLARTRNHALSMARGEFCFVLDADNEVYPHCLSRLAAVLDENPEAVFAYGLLEKFSGSEPVGLMSFFPWEPRRLRAGNYIDAMAMMRTSVVRNEFGGYPTDRRLHGWEDYALWCAVANAGGHAIRVPEIVARYRVAKHSMLSLTNISTTDALSVIIEANPVLMAGVIAPD